MPRIVAAMWKGSGRSLFQTLVLENFKFTLFVITPVITASIFHSDRIVEYIVRNRGYVSYPAEESRSVPTNEEELRVAKAEMMARRAGGATVQVGNGRRGGAMVISGDK